MKQMNFSLLKRAFSLLLVASTMSYVLSSCGKDDEVGPSPTLSMTSTAAAGIVGASVSVDVMLTAAEGAKSLEIKKNGVLFQTVTLAGQKSHTHKFAYTIESLAVGSVVNFGFTLTDSKDRKSNEGIMAVTVTAVPPKPTKTLTGTYSGNITFSNDTIYMLDGFVRIGEDLTLDGTETKTGVLTIEPGTIIMGVPNKKGTLVIQRGSKINAVGTVDNPIIFTSGKPAGQREPNDWGGIVICGKAKNNLPGGKGQLEGNYGGFHGGNDDSDNSGELKYVRIEFAGVPINPNQELNSLTMGSVGSGTKISYVMCSYGQDDSFEWFGGKVDAKYLIAFRGADDDLDVDNGYSGNVQFALCIRDRNLADQSGSNGFEVDNDGSGSNATPATSAKFSNVSIIGPKATKETAIAVNFQCAAHLRRSNKIQIYNSFLTGYPNGFFIDGPTTIANANTTDGLVLKSNILAGVQEWGGNGFGAVASTDEQTIPGLPFGTNINHPNNPRGFVVQTSSTAPKFTNGVWEFTPANIGEQNPIAWFRSNNTILSKWQDAGLNADNFAAVPSLLPTTGSALLAPTTAPFFTGLPTFFTSTTFVGAFGTTDWTSGWAEWNPNAAIYK